jgi:pyruvate dehydrogenase E1 component alpha subunit
MPKRPATPNKRPAGKAAAKPARAKTMNSKTTAAPKAVAKTGTNGTASAYGKEQLLKWYEEMLLMRRFEEKAGQLYGQQKIKGFCHLYIGQEAVGAGIESAIRPDDYVITAYRDHGQALARGIHPNEVMAELFGKVGGCSKGKGGSMHMFSKEKNFLGGHGIVGGQIPLGAGIAFGIKYRKEDKVCICLFGDGAARQGALHEAFNLAMMWKLPVIFICENNFYAMGTSVERSSNVTDIAKLGLAYDMPSEQVDGMDVFEVHEKVKAAADRCRRGDGPVFLEMRTYRYRGHSMSDPAKYRTKEELEKYKEQDPVIRLQHMLLDKKLMTEAELDTIDQRVKDVVQASVDFSEASPFPEPSEIYKDIYVGEYPFIIESHVDVAPR